jgi:hypothetical protein
VYNRKKNRGGEDGEDDHAGTVDSWLILMT